MRCAKASASGLPPVVRLHNDEFIAAQPGDKIFHSRQCAQPLADRIEKEIAAVVAERVVHLLEVIDVNEMHGDLAAER